MSNVFCIGWVILILYILLETDAIPKWAELMKLKFFKYSEFEKQKNTFGNVSLSYKYFLLSKYPNFFVYLITCQECLGTWFTIFAYLIWSNQLGGWETFGVTTLGVFAGASGFKRLLKYLYE